MSWSWQSGGCHGRKKNPVRQAWSSRGYLLARRREGHWKVWRLSWNLTVLSPGRNQPVETASSHPVLFYHLSHAPQNTFHLAKQKLYLWNSNSPFPPPRKALVYFLSMNLTSAQDFEVLWEQRWVGWPSCHLRPGNRVDYELGLVWLRGKQFLAEKKSSRVPAEDARSSTPFLRDCCNQSACTLDSDPFSWNTGFVASLFYSKTYSACWCLRGKGRLPRPAPQIPTFLFDSKIKLKHPQSLFPPFKNAINEKWFKSNSNFDFELNSLTGETTPWSLCY